MAKNKTKPNGSNDKPDPGEEVWKFLVWWKGDPQRALCTLEQASGAYCSTFPGRLHSLLVELLKPFT